MSISYSEPSDVGLFFDYPENSTGSVIQFLPAARSDYSYGTRMTCQSIKALCVLLEGLCERFVIPTLYDGCDVSSDDDLKNVSIPSIGCFATPEGREIIQSLFKRCRDSDFVLELAKAAFLIFSGSVSATIPEDGEAPEISVFGCGPQDIPRQVEVDWCNDDSVVVTESCSCDSVRWSSSDVPGYFDGWSRDVLVECKPVDVMNEILQEIGHGMSVNYGAGLSLDDFAPSWLAGVVKAGGCGNWIDVGDGGVESVTRRRANKLIAEIQTMIGLCLYTYFRTSFVYSFEIKMVEKNTYYTLALDDDNNLVAYEEYGADVVEESSEGYIIREAYLKYGSATQGPLRSLDFAITVEVDLSEGYSYLAPFLATEGEFDDTGTLTRNIGKTILQYVTEMEAETAPVIRLSLGCISCERCENAYGNSDYPSQYAKDSYGANLSSFVIDGYEKSQSDDGETYEVTESAYRAKFYSEQNLQSCAESNGEDLVGSVPNVSQFSKPTFNMDELRKAGDYDWSRLAIDFSMAVSHRIRIDGTDYYLPNAIWGDVVTVGDDNVMRCTFRFQIGTTIDLREIFGVDCSWKRVVHTPGGVVGSVKWDWRALPVSV